MKKLLILLGILFATLSSVSAKEVWTGINVFSNNESQKFYSGTFDSLSFEKIYAEPLPENPPVATKNPNTTIDEIKALITEYSGEELLSATLLGDKDDKGTHYIIHGRIISSDKDENMVKLLVIQDETGAISIPVDKENLWRYFSVGQDLVVDVTGLYIGMYGGQYQIGVLTYYDDEFGIGCLSFEEFCAHSQKNGYPSTEIEYVDYNRGNMNFPADKPYCIRTSILAFTFYGPKDRVKLMGQLIEICDIKFVNGGSAPFSYFLKTTYNRIEDSIGSRMIICNSGKTPYYNEILPESIGNIRGILQYNEYNNDDFHFELYPRSSEDIMFPTFKFKNRNKDYWSGLTLSKNGKYVNIISSDIIDRVDFLEEEFSARIGTGEWDDPYSVPQILKGVENENNKWVTGYIVGYVETNSGDSPYLIGHTAIFNATLAPNSNILLAESPEETNWQNCIPVQLAYGTSGRDLSLANHPEYLHREVTLRGTTGVNYLSVYGLRNCDTYNWGPEGVYIAPPQVFHKSTEIVDGGKYVLVASGKYIAKPVNESYTYGYLFVEKGNASETVKTELDNAFTFYKEGDYWIIKDGYDRYVYQNASVNNFQVSSDMPTENYLWNVTFDSNGLATITNVSRRTWIQYDSNYTSYGCYPDSRGTLPALYVLTQE